MIENNRTFALPFESQTYTFKMFFKYDSWNRIQKMTYPDGEVVYYDYNLGGMLKSVHGKKNNVEYMYVKDIYYNQFELKDSVFYGNGSRVSYEYDSLQRLSRLCSWTAGGDTMQKIAYTYDSVSNITGIHNTAPMLTNGLGNPYFSQYVYDNLYRLTRADGWWYGESMSYQVQMAYYSNGRILRKCVNAPVYTQTATSNSLSTVQYDNYYHYNSLQPNTLFDIDGSDQQFEWNAQGNMTRHTNGSTDRYLCWDEQNRLMGVKDDGRRLSFYMYDANGDRTYKLTGEGELQNISGVWRYYYLLGNATLYASPYLVATKQGYTKHYYAETERIASRIGGGNLQGLDYPVVGQEIIMLKKDANKTTAIEVLEHCLDAIHTEENTKLNDLYNMINSAQSEEECYWYHPDHLGSSSWITYTDGSAVQHLHYLPWGEDFVNQRTGSFSSMYTFSAKEKDTETGYSYFGARYYSSDLSIWLSVDPMAHKYPSLSPYVYCANNPVKLVDPDGEEVWIIGEDGQRYQYKNDGLLYCSNGDVYQGADAFARSAQSSLKELQGQSSTANNILGEFIENTSNNIEIKPQEDVVCYEPGGKTIIRYENGETRTTTHGTIYWNPQGESIPTVDGMQQNGTIDLIHEFVHALDKVRNSKLNTKRHEKIEYMEWTATYYENIVRGEMNAPLRNYYYKQEVAPGRYEGYGENLLRNDKPWKPRKASSIF